jgi:hypothetical protein
MSTKQIFQSRKTLLYIMSIAMIFAFSAWVSLLNNFVIEVANFDGSQIGILQSLREIPGFLAFTVILVLVFIPQQKLAYLSIIVLGIGTALTGIFPFEIGLYLTTILMSIGFHYLETLNQSLSLQWLTKKEAPIVLGKITAAKSGAGIVSLGIIYLMMTGFSVEYKYVYLFFGITTTLIGIVAWILFKKFDEKEVQKKSLKLHKKYWLYYVLTFLSGARRQIFVVFAGFLLVEKFGVDIHNMVLLLLANSILNMYFAPKIGKLIAKFGERNTLRVEYFGLMIVFALYAFTDNLYFAIALFVIDHLLFAMGIALRTYFQKIADPRDITSTSAISFTINHIAAVILPAILGLVWLYSYNLVFLIGVLIVGVSFVLAFLVPAHPQEGRETTLV